MLFRCCLGRAPDNQTQSKRRDGRTGSLRKSKVQVTDGSEWQSKRSGLSCPKDQTK